MNVIIFKRPDGRQEVIDCKHVHDEDAAWFQSNNVSISMEDIGGMFAVYAGIGKVDEDGEPDELIEISGTRDCFETLSALRKQCELAMATGEQA
jgi:hypothetical protein